MPTEAEIDAALEAVIGAARYHRAILRAGTANEDEVWRAYVALNNATVRYDDLISEEYDEVTPWDCEYLDSGDADRPDLAAAAAEPDALRIGDSVTICVRQRRDYQVPDVSRLLRIAGEARVAAWGQHDPEHARTPVTNVGEAVYELVQSGDGTVAALDGYPADLVPGNGVLVVNAVERPLTLGDTPDGEEDEPFVLSPADPLLYRLDEEIVEDDSNGDGAPGDLAEGRNGGFSGVASAGGPQLR